MKYTELEFDDHGFTTHYVESNGLECWCTNTYDKSGKFEDVRITKIKFPKNWKSVWFNSTYEKDTTYKFFEIDGSIYSEKVEE